MSKGYSGTRFGRGDVESAVGRKLTREEWDKVQNTYEWRKGLPDRLTELGWSIIEDAITAAGIKKEETDA